jgi:hypothetical protein
LNSSSKRFGYEANESCHHFKNHVKSSVYRLLALIPSRSSSTPAIHFESWGGSIILIRNMLHWSIIGKNPEERAIVDWSVMPISAARDDFGAIV